MKNFIFRFLLVLCLVTSVHLTQVKAVDLDWSGQFLSESHWIYNYSLERGNVTSDATRSAAGGYYISGGGSENANFQSLFLRLRPSLIVNDNLYIKSEWWLGSPIYGFFGAASPYALDQKYYYSTQSRGSSVTAQRFWAELITNLGVVQVGRAPLNWGLGVVWNNRNDLNSRYPSTGDVVRLVSKFGSFLFSPSFIKYSAGNNVGGACQVSGVNCTPVEGDGDVVDYSISFKYENLDEDLEIGVNFIRRLVGSSQDTASGYQFLGSGAGANYNTWDLYGKKHMGKLDFGVEVPIANGQIGGADYKSLGIATEVDWSISDFWKMNLKGGYASGQENISSTAPDSYRAFYFHPDYRVGLIMFNYQFNNFSGPNLANDASLTEANLGSPYDNPIVNATYLSVASNYQTGKWNLRGALVFANALKTASNSGRFFNTWTRNFVDYSDGPSQSAFMGWEADFGAQFNYDRHFTFDFDFGLMFPGGFYKFSNTSQENGMSPVFAVVMKASASF